MKYFSKDKFLQYHERLPNGQMVMRDERAESVEVAKFERKIEDLMESVRSEMERRWEHEMNHTEKSVATLPTYT